MPFPDYKKMTPQQKKAYDRLQQLQKGNFPLRNPDTGEVTTKRKQGNFFDRDLEITSRKDPLPSPKRKSK